jgi:hypothetical protein
MRPPAGSGPWPQTTALQDTGRSGRVSFVAADAPVSGDFCSPRALCTAVFPAPVASIVQVRVGLATALASGIAGGRAITRRTFDFPAGGRLSFISGQSTNGFGRLVFEYGAGAAIQRVECDLKSGSYQLPPSEQVTVTCQIAAQNTENGFKPDVSVGGAIVEGLHIEPTLPTFTYAVNEISPGEIESIFIPDNARDVEMWAVIGDPSLLPILTLSANPEKRNGAPFMLRDYENGIFLPPCAARLAGTNFTSYALGLDANIATAAAVQFTLDL